jgi:ATP-dependent Lon protease
VILPIDVKANVEEDLTAEQVSGVTIHYASRIEDVLDVALPKTVGEAVQDEEVREEVLAGAE